MSRHLQTLFLLAVLSFLFVIPTQAQVTTASMSGTVMFQDEPVIGATVLAVHEPSGTNYGTITNVDGRFSLQGMRTGGPYKVTISYVGYQSAVYSGITLQLGENYNLNVKLKESSETLDEIVITAAKTKFNTEKTGATTNISSSQITSLPTINRSISDIARLSPYASDMSFAGGDGRSTNFTVDGANFNNNFGLSDNLPGGGNPISMDAIEEVQVVIAPFDVRQTNFIGGGINAITKSGTNTFKGSAYTYFQNQNMRGNSIDGEDLGARAKESKTIYGATFGGPIIKNKLFFFANVEVEKQPQQVIKWRARTEGEQPDENNYISRTTLSDMQKVSDFLRDKYGYDTGSATNFPADEKNLKLLGRIDWNITNGHKLSVRYNYTKNTAWNAPNANSMDGGSGSRLYNTSRVGYQSMSFANSMYSQDNKVSSVSADLNSRFSDKISNQLLFTYTDIEDMRGTNSSPFPFIDILAGKDAEGNQIMEPYMSAGYELFTYNNGVKNKITSVIDNFTYFAGDHKITAAAIAREIGILRDGTEAVEGAVIDKMSDEELRDFVPQVSVYARVSPERKIRIVRAWQQRGNLVAMTGDGVNDAPALKQADIGVAMGITGTEVAKDAAGMVLADDDFATIVKAVKNGRNVYANIKRAVQFLLSGNTAGILMVLYASLMGLPVPFSAVHLLFINLLTDSLPAIALGLEPHTDEVMREKPRPRNEDILTKPFLLSVGMEGLVIAAATITAFYLGLSYGGAAAGQTMAFSTLCLSRLFHSFSCKSQHPVLLTRKFWNNRALLGAFAAGSLLLGLVLLVPALESLFSVAPLSIGMIGAVVGLAFCSMLTIQLLKRFRR